MPASWTADSCWIERSLMLATTGAASASAAARPAGFSRLCRETMCRRANSNSGVRASTRPATAASPCARRRSQGSIPPGAMVIEVSAANFWSSSKARSAAFCPAASPSKVKITSAVALSISSRRRILMWSPPKEVPQVAMAVVTPARWQAITSV